MNQILYVENKKTSGGPLEIKTIGMIFAILCIVFGIFLIGKSSFALIHKEESTITTTIPLVEISQKNNELNVKITHDKSIDKIIYSWNKNKEVVLQGKGRTDIDETIEVPIGTNTLLLKVVDISGKTVSYNEEYTGHEGDVIEPVIEFEPPTEQKVKIVVKDETELDYIEYYWNKEDATKIDAKPSSPKQIEVKIDILKGENTLTVVAVDKSGNESKNEQIYKGATKPKINATRDGSDLLIKVTDEEEIQKIEYVLNGIYYSTDPENTGETLKSKGVEFKQTLASGDNKITITAYNISGLKTEFTGEITI